MAQRKRYTDKFRADCVAMLTALGYPEKNGSLPQVSKSVHVPERTLRRWYKSETQNVPDSVVRQEKKDLATLFEELAYRAVGVANETIDDEDAKGATTVAAIAVDKMRLLLGLPTQIIEYAPRLEQLFRLMEANNHNPGEVLQRMIERYQQMDVDVIH